MSKLPTVIDVDTGEILRPNLPVIPKGPSTGSNNNINGMINVEAATAVYNTAQGIWDSLTPEQKEKVKKVATKAPVEAISGLQYLPDAFWALGQLFSGELFSRKKKSSRGATKKTINTNQNIIPTSGGQYTIINKPSEPTRKKKGVTAIPPLF